MKIFFDKLKLIPSKLKLNYILLIILPFLLTFIVEAITRGSIESGWIFISTYPQKFLYNSLVVALTASPVILVKRKLFLSALISLTWMVLGVADNILIQLRGMPLTGSDIAMIKSGLLLINQYFTNNQIFSFSISLLIIIILLLVLFIKSPKSKVNYKIALPSVLVFIFIFPQITNYAISQRVISRNFWNITNAYTEYGFPYSFLTV